MAIKSLTVASDKVRQTKRGRTAVTIGQEWYDFVDAVWKDPSVTHYLPVKEYGATSKVNAILKTVAEKRGYEMAKRDSVQSGKVMRAVARVIENDNVDTARPVDTKDKKDKETHVMVHAFLK